MITELGVGEALVSFLDEKGIPGMVERAMIMPPHSQIGPITPEQRAAIIKNSVVAGVYETAVDRESAYERLKGKVAASGTTAPAGGVAGSSGWWMDGVAWWSVGCGGLAAWRYSAAGGGEECRTDDGKYGGAAVDSRSAGVVDGWVFEAIVLDVPFFAGAKNGTSILR